VRRRAAWAAYFLGTVVVFSAAPFVEALAGYAPTELRLPIIAKNVLVGDVPEEVDEKGTPEYQICIRVGQGFRIAQLEVTSEIFRASEYTDGKLRSALAGPSIDREIAGQPLDSHSYFADDGRRLPVIDEIKAHVQRRNERRFQSGRIYRLKLKTVVLNTQENVAALDSGESVGGLLGGFGGNASEFVCPDQEDNLRGRNDSYQSREDAQDERIEGDGVFPRPGPYRRKPLPQGFGWLMLIGAAVGTSFGSAYVLLVFWLVNRPGKAPAKGKAHYGRKQGPE
jgi:hypothetical protein